MWKLNIFAWGDEVNGQVTKKASRSHFAQRRKGFFFFLFSLLLISHSTLAGSVDIYHFTSDEASQRFQHLTRELRCLVCQNQSLADSDAGLAKDLRDKIYGLIQEGKTDEEIRSFLVSRYGRFILFSPPLSASTWFLWSFPALLLVGMGGAVFFLRHSKRSVH